MLKKGMVSQALCGRCISPSWHNAVVPRMAMATASGRYPEDVLGAICLADNRLAAEGLFAGCASLQLTIPQDFDEAAIKAMTKAAAEGLDVLGIRAETAIAFAAGGLDTPVITAVVSGEGQRLFEALPAEPGQDIVMAGYAGRRGAMKLALMHRKALLARFNPAFLAPVFDSDACEMLSARNAVKIAADLGERRMLAVGDGGIFTALWDLGKRDGLGLAVYQKAIPIRQETIEICDFVGMDPYQILGTGALLIASDHGGQLREALAGAGIPAAVIGHLTADADRVIISHEEKRYLEPFRYERVYQE